MSVTLHDFIVANREQIIDRTRLRVRERSSSKSSEVALEHGIPSFLIQLADALAPGADALQVVSTPDVGKKISDSAGLHGHDLLRKGFTVAQVVHNYGDVCQVVTELAGESNAAISAEDFQVFNQYLDEAIAGAVTAFGSQRELDLAYQGTERMGVLAHELRNLLNTAILSFDAIKRGTVGIGGSTGAIHSRSLSALRDLVERSLAEVRLEAGVPTLAPVSLLEFIEEIELSAGMQAEGYGLHLHVHAIDGDVMIAADRQLLASALSNLLQNAFKYTRTNGSVSLVTRVTKDRVMIDICDQCGGLPEGKAAELFRPFVRGSSDLSGLGLGLSIALNATRANSGEIRVRDIPGEGCVFTIDLPRQPSLPTHIFRSVSTNAIGVANRGKPPSTGAPSSTRPKSKARAR